MKNQEIKGSLNLDPHFINKWVFNAIFDFFWQIIFKQGDKHLYKLLHRSLYGGIHLLQFINV